MEEKFRKITTKGRSEMKPGEIGLQAAINEFMQQIEKNLIDEEATQHGLFSFILTKKQRFQINKICQEQDWVDPQEKGITLTKQYFQHVLSQRSEKDKVNSTDCAAIIANAFNIKSKIAINKKRYEGDTEREQQALLFCAEETITSTNISNLYGVAVIEVSLKEITPITAYHARGAKIKAF
ncbi:hypothetical protein [Shewanella oncorhynchi]|uniref:hypothetical protein n=1 Tax=Shewanella oncorhynchi TaxID=2726434 RepID=UPI003D7A0AEB